LSVATNTGTGGKGRLVQQQGTLAIDYRQNIDCHYNGQTLNKVTDSFLKLRPLQQREQEVFKVVATNTGTGIQGKEQLRSTEHLQFWDILPLYCYCNRRNTE